MGEMFLYFYIFSSSSRFVHHVMTLQVHEQIAKSLALFTNECRRSALVCIHIPELDHSNAPLY